MAEALRLGINRKALYSMRDAGVVEPLSRGVCRLASLKPLAHPDLVTVVKGVLAVRGRALCRLGALVPRADDVCSCVVSLDGDGSQHGKRDPVLRAPDVDDSALYLTRALRGSTLTPVAFTGLLGPCFRPEGGPGRAHRARKLEGWRLDGR
jgi:hypothetical protein